MNDMSPVGEIRDIGRRTLFGRLGAATLSATAIALLAGRDSLAAGKGGKSAAAASDVGILNTALGAEYDGKVTLTTTVHCREVDTPGECVLAPGTYPAELSVPGQTAKVARAIKVGPTDKTERFELGYIEAGAGKTLLLGGQKLRRIALEAGQRIITVVDEAGPRQVSVRVKSGATVTAN